MRKHKIIIVFLVSMLLLGALTVSAFADSYSDSYDQRVYSPLYYPTSVVFVNSDYTTLLNTDLTATFSLDGNYGNSYVDLGFSNSSVYTDSGGSNVANSNQSVSVRGGLLSGYGYSYYQTSVFNSFYGVSNFVTNIAFLISDVYLPYQLINSDVLRWFGVWNVTFTDDTNTPVVIPCVVTVEYTYVVGDGSDAVVYNDVQTINLDSDSSSADILDAFVDSIPSERTKNGILINSMSLTYYQLSGMPYSCTVNGTAKHSSNVSRGANKAFNFWYGKFGFGTGDIIVETPTIIEQFTTGIDRIWDFQLFGLFSIGNLFSAVLGLTLFTWLLKIFGR